MVQQLRFLKTKMLFRKNGKKTLKKFWAHKFYKKPLTILIHHPLSIIIPSPSNSGKNGKKNSIEAELSFWIFLTAKFTLSFRLNFSMSCVEQKFPTRQSTIQNNPFGLRSTRNFGGLCIFLSAVLVVSQHFHGKNGLETLF